MRLEYFQLIDRIVDLNLADRKIRTEATVPTTSTIFEGHFPGFPLMPGVLLIEAMAQTSGWLVVAVNSFERMAFLAAVKEAKFRTFVRPGQVLAVERQRSRMRAPVTRSPRPRSALDGKSICDAHYATRARFPQRRNEATDAGDRCAESASRPWRRRWLRARGKSGSPALELSPVSAKGPTRIGKN